MSLSCKRVHQSEMSKKLFLPRETQKQVTETHVDYKTRQIFPIFIESEYRNWTKKPKQKFESEDRFMDLRRSNKRDLSIETTLLNSITQKFFVTAQR